MSTFDEIVEATRSDYEQLILQNPLFVEFAKGTLTIEHYATYLRETYHLVRHTTRTLSLAAARLGEDRRELRNWFLEQANEENGHELFCIKDLRNLGYDAEAVVKGHPGPGAWGLVCQNYYMAGCGDPIGILGVASATEGMGAQTAGVMAEQLVERLGIPKSATSFLVSHSGFDVKHLAEAKRAIDSFVRTEEDRAYVIQGRRMTFHFYAQVFREATAHGVELRRAA